MSRVSAVLKSPWGVGGAFVGACGLLGWLRLVAPGAVTIMLGVLYAAIVVGFVVRIRRARGHRFRDGLAPAVDAIEIVQDIYLSRPGSDVTYGDAQPDLTLFVDQPEPDPANLSGVRPASGNATPA